MATDLSAGLGKASLPTLAGQASLRPLDNLMCPAVAIEIAPLLATNEDATPVTDPDYQQRLIAALTAALQAWRDHAEPAVSAAQPVPKAAQ